MTTDQSARAPADRPPDAAAGKRSAGRTVVVPVKTAPGAPGDDGPAGRAVPVVPVEQHLDELRTLATTLLPPCQDRDGTAVRGGQWRQVVLAHTRSLACEVLAAYEAGTIDDGADGCRAARAARIADLLRTASCVATVRSTPGNWWDGRLYEQAWLNLHEAEASLCNLLPEDELRAHGTDLLPSARRTLGADDERVEALTTQLGRTGPGDGTTGSLARTVEHVARATYRAADDAYAQSRGFRNRLVRLTGLAVAAVVAMTAAAGWWLDFGLDEDPPGRWAAPLIVGVFGVVGAFITAVQPVARSQGTRNPFNLPFYQLLLKLAMGPLFALVGVLLVRSGVVVPDALVGGTAADDITVTQLAVLAVLFGSAQHAVTRVVDQRVTAMVAPDVPDTPAPVASGAQGANR